MHYTPSIHTIALSCMVLSTIAVAPAMTAPVAAATTAAVRDAAWVDSRVQEIQPKPEERRLDEIGWAKDIREAEKLAKANNRPILLFTHDGRMGTGRC